MAKSSTSTSTEDGSTQDVQTAESQTKINSAPTLESSATDTRPVDTVNGGLVFSNGTSAEAPAATDEAGSYNLTAPDGSRVTVTSSARRDTLLGRGYTAS